MVQIGKTCVTSILVKVIGGLLMAAGFVLGIAFASNLSALGISSRYYYDTSGIATAIFFVYLIPCLIMGTLVWASGERLNQAFKTREAVVALLYSVSPQYLQQQGFLPVIPQQFPQGAPFPHGPPAPPQPMSGPQAYMRPERPEQPALAQKLCSSCGTFYDASSPTCPTCAKKPADEA